MKILFVGTVLENSGWGVASRNYVLAMDSVGLDVVVRPVRYSNTQTQIPQRLQELIDKNSENCDIVIQYCLPHNFDYNGNFKKNIGQFVYETSNFSFTNWSSKINTLDEVWVPNHHLIDICKNSRVQIPIKVVPHTFDLSKYDNNLQSLQIPQLQDSFVFYFIGEFNRRKNLAALIKAFHTEFSVNEPVDVLIKTHIPNMHPNQMKQELTKYCNEIKNSLKLYPSLDLYKKEVLITEFLQEEHIFMLHKTCDCLVIPSFAEGFHQPGFDAMALGKSVIGNDTGGIREYLNQETGWPVKNREEPCFGMENPVAGMNLYSARENFWNPDIYHMMKCMRECYENEKLRQQKTEKGLEKIQEFSYEKIGNLVKGLLNEK